MPVPNSTSHGGHRQAPPSTSGRHLLHASSPPPPQAIQVTPPTPRGRKSRSHNHTASAYAGTSGSTNGSITAKRAIGHHRRRGRPSASAAAAAHVVSTPPGSGGGSAAFNLPPVQPEFEFGREGMDEGRVEDKVGFGFSAFLPFP